MKKIEINPITRLEGHGKIAIFLDDNGNVEEAFFQVVELRGYERFLIGMPMEEVPRTVSTICGVCRGVHFTASMKAMDQVFGVEPTRVAKKLREIFFCAHQVEDHTAILYALGLPDYVVGPEASAAERNLIGLIKKVGVELGKEVLKKRACAVKIFELLGGKPIHPVSALPGGWSKSITEEERQKILEWGKELVELGKLTLKIFEDVILNNKEYMNLVTGDMYKTVVNYMGTVNSDGKVAYYDGIQKIVDTKGNEIASFTGKEYLSYVAERVIPWSYLKVPYLKQKGWKGIADGDETSLYSVGPLARLNVANGMDTPLAQEAYEKMFSTFNKRPIHYIQAYHWARAIETLNAAEKIVQLASDPDIVSDDVRRDDFNITKEGIGIVEAPRGTLIHHYKTDENAIVTDVNLIVATTQNKGPINVSIKKAAKHFIKEGKVNDKLLNYVEMAFRPYDLCLACATHAIKPGSVPIEIDIFTKEGKLYKKLRNF